MSREVKKLQLLMDAVDEALAMLEGQAATDQAKVLAGPLPSLLDQCRSLVEQSRALDREPVRTIHHFACTGGTLISRCIAGIPNVFLMSEVDPLSPLGYSSGRPAFSPTDLIRHLHYAQRPLPEGIIEATFMAAFKAIYDKISQEGLRIVVRDHTHSHYCTGKRVADRRNLRAMLDEAYAVQPIVTVRDPVESYISLINLRGGNLHFNPGDFNEYCRRYSIFLDDYDDVVRFKYEDFVLNPEGELEKMCAALRLPYEGLAIDLLPVMQLTGDSGRSGDIIATRPRKPISDSMASEMSSSVYYSALKNRLGYE